MGKTISEYAACPVADAFKELKEEFRKAKESREAKAVPTEVPEEYTSETDNGKPSGMAYLVLAGAVVTLLAPLKIIGCSVALLSNYAYSPVTIILTGLMLLLQKIGWMKRVSDPGVLSTAGKCIFLVAFWPSYISGKMAECTTAKEQSNSTVYLHKLHFLQMKLMVSLFDLKSEEEQPKEESSEEESPGGGMFVGVG